jgi:hypothetical protein
MSLLSQATQAYRQLQTKTFKLPGSHINLQSLGHTSIKDTYTGKTVPVHVQRNFLDPLDWHLTDPLGNDYGTMRLDPLTEDPRWLSVSSLNSADTSRYKGVGRRLMQVAQELSHILPGRAGCVQLQTKQESAPFYYGQGLRPMALYTNPVQGWFGKIPVLEQALQQYDSKKANPVNPSNYRSVLYDGFYMVMPDGTGQHAMQQFKSNPTAPLTIKDHGKAGWITHIKRHPILYSTRTQLKDRKNPLILD